MKTLNIYKLYLELKTQLETLKTMQYNNDYDLQLNDTINSLENEIERLENLNILKLSFDTGTVWLNVIYTEGSENDDLMNIIDELATNENCGLKFYEASEVLGYEESYIEESFLPINGGACYTDMIVSSKQIILLDYHYIKTN